MNFSFTTSRNKKARPAKDHGKKFQSKLTASFIYSEHIVNI